MYHVRCLSFFTYFSTKPFHVHKCKSRFLISAVNILVHNLGICPIAPRTKLLGQRACPFLGLLLRDLLPDLPRVIGLVLPLPRHVIARDAQPSARSSYWHSFL